MASINFKALKERTAELIGDRKKSIDEKAEVILEKTVSLQADIKSQFNSLKKEYSKNKTIYNSLYDEISLLRRKSNRPKYDKIKDPLARKGGGGSGGGGLLGALMSALGVAGLFLKPLLSKIAGAFLKIGKGLTASLGKLLGGVGKAGKGAIKGVARAVSTIASKGIQVGKAALSGIGSKLKTGASAAFKGLKNSRLAQSAANVGRSGVQRAVVAGSRLGLGPGIGNVAMRTVAGLLGRGVVGAAAGAIGMPLLIASAAAAVGYGAYKLGRYLKLSEKLDEFIKKVSNGKYKDLGDFLLGLVNGSVGKDLFVWVKDKIATVFTDAMTYLKNKTNDLLGKYSPFINDPATQAGGADPEAVDEDGGANKGNNTNKSEGAAAGESPSASGGVPGAGSTSSPGTMQFSMKSMMEQKAGGSNTSSVPLMMEGVDGYSASGETGGSSAPAGPTGGLAWKAITKGKNTKINSRFGKRKGNGTVSSDHKGLDIDASIGTPIYAPEGGTVSRNFDAGGGNQGFLTGDSGTRYGFAHLSSVNAKGRVEAGALIAKSGNTGKSTGPHIHLSIRKTKGGARVNPEFFVIPGSKKSVSTAKGIGDMRDSISSDNTQRYKEQSKNTPSTTYAVGDTGDSPSIKSSPDISMVSSFSNNLTNITNNESSHSPTQSQSTPKRSAPKVNTPDYNASTMKSGAIEGKLATLKDPRGALKREVMMAVMSPLYV